MYIIEYDEVDDEVDMFESLEEVKKFCREWLNWCEENGGEYSMEMDEEELKKMMEKNGYYLRRSSS